jgi:class 3 adenylate cyclase/pimeloyl-ACP methyl ester carboxylesterase
MDQPQIRYTKAADGVSIAYSRSGEGATIVVMPYHTVSHIGMEWEHPVQRSIYQRLAAGAEVVCFDPRGTGLSQRPAACSPETEQLDLQAVVAACDGPVVLVGRGLSGPVAIRYAALHPEELTHLVLYDTALSHATLRSDSYLAAIQSVYDTLPEGHHEEALRIAARIAQAKDPSWFHTVAQAASDREGMRQRSRLDEDSSALAARVTTPVLVIAEQWPSFDIRRSTQLAAALPTSRLVVIPRDDDDGWLDWVDVSEELYRFVGLAVPEADRPSRGRVQTILFTDIVGHTEMMQRLGDAKGRDVLREHERITRETLKQHGGAEVKTMGDGFMASFGSVTSALECAIALQRAFDAWNTATPDDQRLTTNPQLNVRVGLNAGEPIEEDGDLFGATVILASRIAAKAGPGEILVPDTVRGLLSGKGFMFGDRGEFIPKGFDEGVRLWDVRWRE